MAGGGLALLTKPLCFFGFASGDVGERWHFDFDLAFARAAGLTREAQPDDFGDRAQVVEFFVAEGREIFFSAFDGDAAERAGCDAAAGGGDGVAFTLENVEERAAVVGDESYFAPRDDDAGHARGMARGAKCSQRARERLGANRRVVQGDFDGSSRTNFCTIARIISRATRFCPPSGIITSAERFEGSTKAMCMGRTES